MQSQEKFEACNQINNYEQMREQYRYMLQNIKENLNDQKLMENPDLVERAKRQNIEIMNLRNKCLDAFRKQLSIIDIQKVDLVHRIQ